MATLARTLGIDGGKSGLRIAVRDGDHQWKGEAQGTFYGAGRDDTDGIIFAVESAIRASGYNGQVDSLCAGLTGMPADSDEITRLSTSLSSLTGASRLILVEDCVIAHYGALAGPGTVVSAGTGTVVLAIGEGGTHARRDGWGPLFGDRGSGFDIGRRGLVAAWGALDGVAPPTLLTGAIRDFLGSEAMLEVQRFYGAPNLFSRVSSFAPRVFDSAVRGDQVAAQILEKAAAQLADSAKAAAEALPDRPTTVSFSGRLFDAGDRFVDRFALKLIARGLELRPPREDALSGALALATVQSGCFAPYTGLISPIDAVGAQ